jgi:hypothetical protein
MGKKSWKCAAYSEWHYSVKLTLMLLNSAKKTNNCNAAKTVSDLEANIQRCRPEKKGRWTQTSLQNLSVHLQELKHGTVKHVHSKRKTGVTVTNGDKI